MRRLKKYFSKITKLIGCILILISILILLESFIGTNNKLLTSKDSTPEQASFLIKNSCPGNNKENCYAKQFGVLTEKKDMNFAKQTLLTLQNIDPQNANGCHLIAHAISIAETNKNPENWLNLLKEQDVYSCSGGFLHGVLEAHMGSDPNFTLNAYQFSKICSQVKDQQRGRLSCNHNLGHLLLVQELHNFRKASVICEEIVNFDEKYECLSGMFMENITRLNLEAHGLANIMPWNEENTQEVENICKSFTGLPAQACWKVISYMYYSMYVGVPDKVFQACNTRTPTKKTAEECYIYGAGNMVTFANFDQKNLSKICTVYSYEDPLYKRCMFSVLGSMMGSTSKFNDRVINHCLNASESFRNACFNRMGYYQKIKLSSSNKQESICSQVPDPYQNICWNGKK
jgi:hypothetical protein